jgi:hypothetical protein
MQKMSQIDIRLIDTRNFIEYNHMEYQMYIGGISSGTKRTRYDRN